MIEKLEKYGDVFLARGAGFYDSYFPVIYCDDALYVVDINKEASGTFGEKLRGKCFSAHFTQDDLGKVTALMKMKKSALRAGTPYVQTAVVKMRGARHALVTVLDCYGGRFAEIRLFRSLREMLSFNDSRKLIFPVEPATVEYKLLEGRDGNEETACELNGLFAYNLISRIYDMACSQDETPELFELYDTVRRIVSEVSKPFDFNSRKWGVRLVGATKFAYPVLSRKNFINLIALVIYVFSKISNGERSTATVRQKEKSAVIEFATTVTRSRVGTTRGDIVFSYVGAMYPSIKAAAKFVEFICSLYGIGCYAEISKNFTLILRLVLNEEGIDDGYSVKHSKRFDMASLREAIDLIKAIEASNEDEEDPS